MATNSPGIDALLLVADGCSVCPVVHGILDRLTEQGYIRHLEVVNLNRQPELAQSYGVRSVPWFRLGELEFQGLHGEAELRYWAEHADSDEGIRQYLSDELEAGHLPAVERMVRAHPRWLHISLTLVADMDAPIQARIGLGALFESLRGDALLHELVPALSALAGHSDARVRGDACYYLGLSISSEALPTLNSCLEDPDSDVREIAREAIDAISA